MSGVEEVCESNESEVKSTGETQKENLSEITDVEEKIIQQIEYYFGDFNLRRDKYMKEKIALDDGWVPLETLITFNRLKALTTDFDQIVTALKKSPNNLIEVNCELTKIRRNPEKPVSENGSYEEDKLKERCVYVKRFPDNITLDELQEFFKKFGTVENILMRRFAQSKKFRGSVFATFATKDDAEKFMNLTVVKYENATLSRETRKEYEKRKDQEIAKIKEQKEKKQKQKEALQNEMEELQNEMEEEKNIKGCLLKLTGVTKELDWAKIKEFFRPFSSLAYVEIKEDKGEAILRFIGEGDAKVALEKAIAMREDKKLIINNVEVEGIVLEGKEENEHWRSVRNSRNAKYKKKNQKGKKTKFGKQNRDFKKENVEKNEDAKVKNTEENESSKNENSQKHKLEKDDGDDQSSAKKQKAG
ncbi:lupus La protein homolog A [Centruroides vittatus]|uniref:lupus La protein homolog A n=1 Tax=Centruroides vittatus TaxID=120091 RepID=UPI003510B1DC